MKKMALMGLYASEKYMTLTLSKQTKTADTLRLLPKMNAARFSWKLKSSRASLFFSGDDQIEEQQQKKQKNLVFLNALRQFRLAL